MLATATLPAPVQDQVRDRLRRPDLGRWLGQVEQVGHCAHPIRMVGGSDTINPTTGEVLSSYTSGSEPDGVTYLRCGNRRRAVCPSCSHQYQGDVFHLIMAGAAGGMKDVPAEVVTHPLVFATVTAPSFGVVHGAAKPGRRGGRRCRPRTGDARQLCPHGRPSWCMAVHQHTDTIVGQPLCVDCYDYHSHLVWQWYAPELWRRFTIGLRRQLARHLGVTETACRGLVRVQFAKVAEFQRRGVVHFHALIRLDGPPTDDQTVSAAQVELEASVLADLVVQAVRSVSCDAAAGRWTGSWCGGCGSVGRSTSGWFTTRPTATSRPVQRCIRRRWRRMWRSTRPKPPPTSVAGDARANPHLRRLRTVVGELAVRAALAGQTGPEGAFKGWSRWADMLGFRGHFASKSRRYSTTLGRLRQARRDHVRRQIRERQQRPVDWADHDQDHDELEPTTLVVGSWRFAGIGWLTTGDAALAAASAARARDD